MIRVRFAPSPTGHLHIGGVRTALFNFLYAKSQNAAFLLRIEDTDRQRSEEKYEQEILASLQWLGLSAEEPPVHQSSRLERYREAAAELAAKGAAYEETDAQGKTALRFRMPKTKEVFGDLVRGKVEFDTELFEDLVIMKSDGFPTYHWACVVDDHDMEISHVIRGEDHLSNTPRQTLLFKAMGWKPPKYAHLPLILGSDGSPLSKRHGAVSLLRFREQGYLPEGILNYLALLGWASADNQEVFSLEQLISKFSIKKINKAGARFDMEKLDWMNGQHMRKLTREDYLARITDFHQSRAAGFSEKIWQRLALLYQARIKTLQDLEAQASYCFSDDFVYDPNEMGKFLPAWEPQLTTWLQQAETLPDFEDDKAIDELTRKTATELNAEAKDLIHPLRFAVSGQTTTPGLFELMSVLGKEKCLNRVRQFLKGGK